MLIYKQIYLSGGMDRSHICSDHPPIIVNYTVKNRRFLLVSTVLLVLGKIPRI